MKFSDSEGVTNIDDDDESVPGAVATGSQLTRGVEIAKAYPVATAPGTDLFAVSIAR